MRRSRFNASIYVNFFCVFGYCVMEESELVKKKWEQSYKSYWEQGRD